MRTSRELSDLLVAWDAGGNGDGVVDLREAVAGLRACGVDGSDDELDALTRGWDTNLDGKLDLSEVCSSVASRAAPRCRLRDTRHPRISTSAI